MENEKKRVRILSLDGGGIRGIIPAVILQHVEDYLAKKKPGTRLADHFDMIAGTSTGGILACIYLKPGDDLTKSEYSAEDAFNFYYNNGTEIFNDSKLSGWKRIWGLGNATEFSPKVLEDKLKYYFKDLKISELRKPCLVTTYNMLAKSAFFFTSFEDRTKREFYVRDVARSTSAAPTYFPPAKINNLALNSGKPYDMINLDGGVFANNPLMCAYAEARDFNFTDRNNDKPTAQDMDFLSIGTGGGGFDLPKIKNCDTWSLLKWAKLVPNIMMDGSIETVGYQMRKIEETLGTNFSNYKRIDVPNEPHYRIYSSDMSNASKENMDNLKIAGERTLEFAIENGLNDFLDKLDS